MSQEDPKSRFPNVYEATVGSSGLRSHVCLILPQVVIAQPVLQFLCLQLF